MSRVVTHPPVPESNTYGKSSKWKAKRLIRRSCGIVEEAGKTKDTFYPFPLSLDILSDLPPGEFLPGNWSL